MVTPKKTTPATKASKAEQPKTSKAEAKSVAPVEITRPSRRELEGTVSSNKMTKTIVVKVNRHIKDAVYKKYVLRSKKFMAHDEKNEAKIGDLVTIIETRPLSRNKRWSLKQIVRRATQSGAIVEG
jgi:small subunit ribosomal protein S17